VVTPRIGKPVEVQALWINALRIAAHGIHVGEDRLRERLTPSSNVSYRSSSGALCDVIDADHEPGKIDRSIRPNQRFLR